MARDFVSWHGIVFRERAQASQSWLCDCDHGFVRGYVIKIDQQPVALENVDDLVQLRLRGDPRVCQGVQGCERRFAMVVSFMSTRETSGLRSRTAIHVSAAMPRTLRSSLNEQ